MLARLLLLLLLGLFAVACGNTAPVDPTATPPPAPTVTQSPTSTPTPSLATLYGIEESDFFTIKQLWDEYLKSERGEPTHLKGQPIVIEGCHAKDSIKIGQDLWIAFSPDGDFDLKDNVVLVTGFASLPTVACYEMAVKYKGTRKLELTSMNIAEFQRFRLIDEKAIRTKR